MNETRTSAIRVGLFVLIGLALVTAVVAARVAVKAKKTLRICGA